MHFAIRCDVCERTHVHKIITALLMRTTKDMLQDWLLAGCSAANHQGQRGKLNPVDSKHAFHSFGVQANLSPQRRIIPTICLQRSALLFYAIGSIRSVSDGRPYVAQPKKAPASAGRGAKSC